MKKLIATLLFSAVVLSAAAQEEKKSEIVKTGINFGPLPAIGYSSDLGWHYGALTDIYWYGDGSVYPDYIWKANVEASWYSKGNSVYHAFFDSKYIIPGIRVSADLTYLGNKTSNFYGFNGAASKYIKDLDKIVEGQGLYLMRRDNFRFELTTQGKIGNSHWGWVAGLAYNYYKTDHAVNKDLDDNRAKDISLYDVYVDHGVIPAQEAKGGHHLEFKAGVVFDTRDHENNPSRGSNLEVFFFGSPDILNGNRGGYRNDYLKMAVHFKQFFTLVPDRLVFGGHVAYQGLIAGTSPFYTLQTIMPINRKNIITDGLGTTNTIRGTVINRFLGNGYVWGNFELRWSFVRFKLFNQNFILATNPFFDLGMVVQPYRLDQLKALAADLTQIATRPDGTAVRVSDLYTGQAEKLHMSAGIGLHIIMNQNFNINFEFGKCFDNNDGEGLGINVGLNYIF
ncbi:MAG: BamA/TamA family outer membrane protein [Bacteroidales bacterium]|nr:BamA/TamA family outer membrane protein [Bacteroidales bacterium]